MSDDTPSGSNPFEFLITDMMRAMGSQAQDPLSMVTQFVQMANTDPASSANADPSQRIRQEELHRIAALHVENLDFLPSSFSASQTATEAQSPIAFANESVREWSPYILALLEAMAPATPAISGLEPENPQEASLMSMIGQFGASLTPMLSAAQVGSLIGHFSKDSLGSNDIVIPRHSTKKVALVSSAVARFAKSWSLPEDSVTLWLLTRELAILSLLSLEHIIDRLDTEIRLHLADMRADVRAAMERLSSINLSDPQALQGFFGDPTALMSGELTDAQRINYEDIEATIAVMEGVATLACRNIGSSVLGNTGSIEEALERRRVEPPEPKRLLGRLFGLEDSSHSTELAKSFADFLGTDDNVKCLKPLYEDISNFPTLFELENLEIWKARLAL